MTDHGGAAERAPLDELRVAIVHEWVSSRAGAEQVFEGLADAFPSADLYCLSLDPDARFMPDDVRPITRTMLDRPWLRDRRALTLPTMPLAWRAVTRPRYDLVVSSSHAFSRWFARPDDGLHLSYVHTPMRYVWTPGIDRRGRALGVASIPARWALRRLDLASRRWTDGWAANSAVVADRIARFYGVAAEVVHPPIDVDRWAPGAPDDRPERGEHVVALSRFVPYKRLDLAIAAADAAGVPITVLGRGPTEPVLREAAAVARVPVEIIVDPPNHVVRHHLQRARALVFPAQDDFGLVPIEAQAAGTPVLALDRFGASESVIDGETGVLVADQSVSALAAGLRRLLDADFDADACIASARRFDRSGFTARVRAWASGQIVSR
ncbi:MAG: glycosyltransferase [Actinomycetota bacterium]